MSEGIGVILPYAVGVAISPVPIIAVILMLFSAKARVNGPMFMAAWALALAVVSVAAYLLAGLASDATEETTTETIKWGQIILGALLLLIALRQWRSRPAPGVTPEMPKWMAGIDAFTPGKAFGDGPDPGRTEPQEPAAGGRRWHGPRRPGPLDGEVVVSLLVYVAIGTSTIAGPVIYYLVGGDKAKATLDSWKGWLAVNNTAVMAVLFVLFGVKLIGEGLPALG